MNFRKILLIGFLALSFLTTGICFGQSQATTKESRAEGAYGKIISHIVFSTLPAEERKELIKLKETDNEKFVETAKKRIPDRLKELYIFGTLTKDERVKIILIQDETARNKKIDEKIAQRKKELEEIKANDPKKYEELMKLSKVVIRKFGIGVVQKHQKKKKWQTYLIFEALTKKEQQKIISLRKQYQDALKQAMTRKRAELEKLKTENPDEFKKVVESAVKKAQERLEEGKKKYPEKFEKFQNQVKKKTEEQFGWLKEEDPAYYQDLVAKFQKKAEGDLLIRGGANDIFFDDSFSK